MTDTHAEAGRSLGADSSVVAACTLASRITGFARIAIIGAVFGPTVLSNVYQATNVLPNIAFNLMAGSLIVSIIVPSIVGHLEDGDHHRVGRLAGSFLGVLLVASSVVAVALVVARPIFGYFLTSGADSELAGDADQAVRVLLVFVAPQIALYAVVSVAMAVQNAGRRFALAAGAPVVENLGVIATVGVFAAMGGGGIEADLVTNSQLMVLGVGSTAAVGAHALLQWWGATRVGVRLLPRFDWRDREVLDMVHRGRPALASAVAHSSVLFVVVAASATVPGGVVAVQLAMQTVQLFIALGARPVAVALLPRASLHHRIGDRARFLEDYGEALWLGGLIAIPATLALVGFADFIGSTIALGRMDTDDAVTLVVVSLIAVAPSVAGQAFTEISRSALFAVDDFLSPALASWMRAGTVFIGAAFATQLSGPTAVLGVLAASVAVGDVASGFYLHQRVRKSQQAFGLFREANLITVGVSLAAVSLGTALAWTMSAGLAAPDLLAFGFGGALTLSTYVIWQRSRSARVRRMIERPVSTLRLLFDRVPGDGRVFGAAVIVIIMADLVAIALGDLLILAIAGVVALGIVALVVVRPVAAAYIYVAMLPFLAGIERGALIPFARPNEGLLLLLFGGLGLRWAGRSLLGERTLVRPTRLDWSLLTFTLLGSVFPILWLIGRGAPVDLLDVIEPVVLWRLAAVYLMVRITVRTPEQLRRVLMIAVGGAAVVAVVSVIQGLGLLGSAGENLLVTIWGPEDVLNEGRSSTTLASALATGDYAAYGAAIAIAWWGTIGASGGRWNRAMPVVACLLVAGAFTTGQFSGWLAVLLCAGVATYMTGRHREVLRLAAPVLAVGVVLASPVLLARLSEFGGPFGVPRSWIGRMDNLSTFYLPHLGDFGFVLGVRPNSVVQAPEQWREEIFLESGYLWLFWAGGIPLFMGFVWFMSRAFRASLRASRREGPISTAGIALTASLVALLVLTTIDKHLQLRGAGDLLIVLLGLSLVGRWSDPPPGVRPPDERAASRDGPGDLAVVGSEGRSW